MNSSTFTKVEQLNSLKSDYLEALSSYKHSHSNEALDRLNAIKEAYVAFIDEIIILE
jgi:hypothetical protein